MLEFVFRSSHPPPLVFSPLAHSHLLLGLGAGLPPPLPVPPMSPNDMLRILSFIELFLRSCDKRSES